MTAKGFPHFLGFPGCSAIVATALAVIFLVTESFAAAAYRKLYDFSSRPAGSLVQGADGALYGTVSDGAPEGALGAIFRIERDGTGFTVLRRFTGEGGDGALPSCGLVAARDGRLYGVTSVGGDLSDPARPLGRGIVFGVNPDGSGYTVLKAFRGDDGGQPLAALIEGSDGVLYGTTGDGGARGGGTIFRINRDGTGFRSLKSFTYSPDGSQPWAALTEGSDGVLYGTTVMGGSNSAGTIFKINRDGSGFSIVYSFTESSGNQPRSRVIQGLDGALFGTTYMGGPVGFSQGAMFRSRGSVFRINRDGSGFRVLKSFNETSGEAMAPEAGLTQAPNGVLYGTCSYGGSDENGGVIFSLNPDGTGYSVVKTFRRDADGSGGINPKADLLLANNGVLYGTTSYGGIPVTGLQNCGVLFALAPESQPSSRLANLSARAVAGSGDSSLIAGFVLSETRGKPLLIRGIGPTLSSYGVSGALLDPTLALNSSGGTVAANDDWGGAANVAALSAATTQLNAFALQAGSRDAALLSSLGSGGAYTAVLEGKSGASGVALIEVYDADRSAPGRLVNVAARSRVGTGDDVLIAGFVIDGREPLPVLIRAVGPTLAGFGVGDALVDPQLAVINQSTGNRVHENDNWTSAANAGAVTAAVLSVQTFPLPVGSKDSAVLANLPPGAYTAVASGVGNTTGVTLIEVYEVPGSVLTGTEATYLLATATAGNGQGSISANPAGPAYPAGTAVTLTPQPASGSIFSGWSGDGTGTLTRLVTMDGNKSVTASFTAATAVSYTLSTAVAGPGQGTIAASPAGPTYPAGTIVTLTAQPAAGSTFSGWSGDGAGTTTRQVTMDGNKSVTASFALSPAATYTIAVANAGNGNGAVTANPAGPAYPAGSDVTLTAQPAAGSTFAGWSGDGTGTTTRQLTMDGNKSVTATFTLVPTPTYTLTTTTAGTGQGTVTRSPSGPAYPAGTVVTLNAQAATGSTFAGWSGDGTGSTSRQVTMDSDKTVIATFTANTTAVGPSSNLRVYPGQVILGSYDPFRGNSVVNGGTLFADGGSPFGGYTWSISSLSALPPGVSLRPDGILVHSGGAVVPGRYTINVTVSDGTRTATGDITFNASTESTAPVNGIPGVQGIATFSQLLVPSFSLVSGRVGRSYGSSLFATLGTGTVAPATLPLTWTVAAGHNLPAGLVLDQARGVISGVPATTGNYTFRIVIRDSGGETAIGSPTYLLTVAP